jgi:hypothetical protein
MMREHGLSRRRMLAMSVAAGSLSIGAIGRNAAAQAGNRIERLDPGAR